MKYEALTTPFKIGNVEIRNRFVMLPMTIEKTDNYAIGDDLIDFYEQRAIGGAGLIEILNTTPLLVLAVFGTTALSQALPVPQKLAISMALSSLLSCSSATSGVRMATRSF